MEQPSLFPDPRPTLSGDEVREVFRSALANTGRLPRSVDLALSGICADHLADALHCADLDLVRRSHVPLRD